MPDGIQPIRVEPTKGAVGGTFEQHKGTIHVFDGRHPVNKDQFQGDSVQGTQDGIADIARIFLLQ